MPAVLSAKKLCKIYPSKPPFFAINDLSFELAPKEILGLLGPNGSGKTTTIQMLLGTLEPTSGSITYFGKDFASYRSEILQSVAFVSTYTHLPWILSVAENLEVFGYLYGLSKKEGMQKAEPLLERFGIHHKKYERVSSLSAGQLTRLMLVKAFFIEPKIALLDEPTASLDPDIAQDICAFLVEQRNDKGTSILFSSHKMEEVMQICDRTIFLKKGIMIANDIPQKLAKTVSTFHITLVIADGLKRTISIAEKTGLKFTAANRTIEILMNEEEIPPFLNALSQEKVTYANIKIEEPSLEDYFLKIAKT